MVVSACYKALWKRSGLEREFCMRSLLKMLGIIGLTLGSHVATAASTPSLSGTTIPSAAQIVDSSSIPYNIWTLKSGQAYENGQLTPSSGVILLLYYGGVVYQENIHHDWWLWASYLDVPVWEATTDPRVISPSGTTVPVATQIIDSHSSVWTLSGGRAYLSGQPTASNSVILLLYSKGVIYQENINHDWWEWLDGNWAATPAPALPSASGSTIPSASQLVDDDQDIWTLSGGQVYENHSLTPSSEATLVLFYMGNIYQENIHKNWWRWNGQSWTSLPSDPRAGKPSAYVASSTTGAGGVTHYAISVVDTGNNHVISTIALPFEAGHLAVSPDATRLYVTDAAKSASNDSYVAVIDTSTGRVLTSSIHVYGLPEAIVVSPDGTRIYVLCDVDYVYAISTATDEVVSETHLNGFANRMALSPDGKKLYVPTEGEVAVMDTATGDLLTPLTTAPTQSFASVAVSPATGRVYTDAGYADKLKFVFDPATGAVLDQFLSVVDPGVFSPDSQRLYGLAPGGISFISVATNTQSAGVTNIDASAFAITPDGAHLYISTGVAGMYTGSIYVADTATYTISTVLPIAATGPIAIVPAP